MAHMHYYMDDSTSQPLDLNPTLVYSGLVADDPGWFNIPHSHDFCEIFYVTDGAGTVQLGSQSHYVEAGDAYIINPWVLHQESSDGQKPLGLVFFAVKDFTLPGCTPNHIAETMDFPIFHFCQDKLGSLFKQLLQEASQKLDYHGALVSHVVCAVITYLVRFSLQLNEEENELNTTCSKVKDYIDANFTASFSLDSLSKLFFISKHYLSHVFKAQIGVSPIKYLTAKRLQLACSLLLETTESITEISHATGYDNPLYFSQVFKKAFGVSPQDYRAQKGSASPSVP